MPPGAALADESVAYCCPQVRKMIREIFGHPMAATDCTVYTCKYKGILAVFHPIGSEPDPTNLQMLACAREATQSEQGNISFWYTARVRIDHAVATLTDLDGNIDSDHVKFGHYHDPATLPEVVLGTPPKRKQPPLGLANRGAPLRFGAGRGRDKQTATSKSINGRRVRQVPVGSSSRAPEGK